MIVLTPSRKLWMALARREMNHWFRSWHGAPTDPKWLLIARRAGTTPATVSACVWALLDYASQNQERGSIDGFDIETYAIWSGVDAEIITAIIASLKDKNIIKDNYFEAWGRRQPKREDNSTKRVRSHRETQCNAMKRNVTQRNAPDTDTDTDKDSEPNGSAAMAANGQKSEKFPDIRTELFQRGLDAIRKATGKPNTSARYLIGRWLKIAQDDALAVLSAIDDSVADHIAEPVSWITARLNKKYSTNQNGNMRITGMTERERRLAETKSIMEELRHHGDARDGDQRGGAPARLLRATGHTGAENSDRGNGDADDEIPRSSDRPRD